MIGDTEEQWEPVIPPDDVIEAICDAISNEEEGIGFYSLKRALSYSEKIPAMGSGYSGLIASMEDT